MGRVRAASVVRSPRESSLLTTYWSESTTSSRDVLADRPCAMGVLNSLFHAALYLPFYLLRESVDYMTSMATCEDPLRSFWCYTDLEFSRTLHVGVPGKGNSNSHGARPVHLIIMMI